MKTQYLLQRFFQEKKPGEIRDSYKKVEVSPRAGENTIRREDIVDAVRHLWKDQYIRLTAPADILPEDVPNFKKRGSFLNLRVPTTRRELLEDRVTIQERAAERLESIDEQAHPGAYYWGIRARHRKLWSLVTIIDGLTAYALIRSKAVIGQAVPEVVALRDYGDDIAFHTESFTDLGVTYKGYIKHLAMDQKTMHADAVEISGRCSCDDDLWSTMANPRIVDDYRFCKHEVAALLLAADMKRKMKKSIALNPLPFTPTVALVQDREKTKRILTKEGKLLSGIRQEVLLWDLVRINEGRNLHYDTNFTSAREVAGYIAMKAYSSSPE
ncbi:hypothetical protein C4573_04770 [Candidatus Woesearchaeota archaeon]|nr:MAG: hypothetical protein C4573_04770 [Candidatus Woesearchaeota archaeon]